jgi:hypothetical protein
MTQAPTLQPRERPNEFAYLPPAAPLPPEAIVPVVERGMGPVDDGQWHASALRAVVHDDGTMRTAALEFRGMRRALLDLGLPSSEAIMAKLHDQLSKGQAYAAIAPLKQRLADLQAKIAAANDELSKASEEVIQNVLSDQLQQFIRRRTEAAGTLLALEDARQQTTEDLRRTTRQAEAEAIAAAERVRQELLQGIETPDAVLEELAKVAAPLLDRLMKAKTIQVNDPLAPAKVAALAKRLIAQLASDE